MGSSTVHKCKASWYMRLEGVSTASDEGGSSVEMQEVMGASRGCET